MFDQGNREQGTLNWEQARMTTDNGQRTT